jgi:hypothetical protein
MSESDLRGNNRAVREDGAGREVGDNSKGRLRAKRAQEREEGYEATVGTVLNLK